MIHPKLYDVIDIPMVGNTRVVVKDADGNIIDDIHNKNNILLTIRKPIIRLLGGVKATSLTDTAALPFVNSIGFGTDDTPANINQTSLVAPITGSQRMIATAPTFSDDGLRATFAILFGLIEVGIDGQYIKEACLYTADGTAIARVCIGSYQKIAGLYMEFYWEIGYEA